jgi:hypothetical protein
MVIAGPGVNGNKECHTPVSLIDLYPTLLDYCNLPGSPNSHGNNRELDGFSLLTLLEDPVFGTELNLYNVGDVDIYFLNMAYPGILAPDRWPNSFQQL